MRCVLTEVLNLGVLCVDRGVESGVVAFIGAPCVDGGLESWSAVRWLVCCVLTEVLNLVL